MDVTLVHKITSLGVGSPLATPCLNLTILFVLENKLKLKKKVKNAMDDIKESVNELKFYREKLFIKND